MQAKGKADDFESPPPELEAADKAVKKAEAYSRLLAANRINLPSKMTSMEFSQAAVDAVTAAQRAEDAVERNKQARLATSAAAALNSLSVLSDALDDARTGREKLKRRFAVLEERAKDSLPKEEIDKAMRDLDRLIQRGEAREKMSKAMFESNVYPASDMEEWSKAAKQLNDHLDNLEKIASAHEGTVAASSTTHAIVALANARAKLESIKPGDLTPALQARHAEAKALLEKEEHRWDRFQSLEPTPRNNEALLSAMVELEKFTADVGDLASKAQAEAMAKDKKTREAALRDWKIQEYEGRLRRVKDQYEVLSKTNEAHLAALEAKLTGMNKPLTSSSAYQKSKEMHRKLEGIHEQYLSCMALRRLAPFPGLNIILRLGNGVTQLENNVSPL